MWLTTASSFMTTTSKPHFSHCQIFNHEKFTIQTKSTAFNTTITPVRYMTDPHNDNPLKTLYYTLPVGEVDVHI